MGNPRIKYREPKIINFSETYPIKDGPFWGFLRMGGGAKKPPLSKISHIHATIMKFGSYTFPKEDLKTI